MLLSCITYRAPAVPYQAIYQRSDQAFTERSDLAMADLFSVRMKYTIRSYYPHQMYSAGAGLFGLFRSKFSLCLLVIFRGIDPVLDSISRTLTLDRTRICLPDRG